MSMGAAILFTNRGQILFIHEAKFFKTRGVLPIMSANMRRGFFFLFFFSFLFHFNSFYTGYCLDKCWVFRARDFHHQPCKGGLEGSRRAVGFTKNDVTTLTQRFFFDLIFLFFLYFFLFLFFFSFWNEEAETTFLPPKDTPFTLYFPPTTPILSISYVR